MLQNAAISMEDSERLPSSINSFSPVFADHNVLTIIDRHSLVFYGVLEYTENSKISVTTYIEQIPER